MAMMPRSIDAAAAALEVRLWFASMASRGSNAPPPKWQRVLVRSWRAHVLKRCSPLSQEVKSRPPLGLRAAVASF